MMKALAIMLQLLNMKWTAVHCCRTDAIPCPGCSTLRRWSSTAFTAVRCGRGSSWRRGRTRRCACTTAAPPPPPPSPRRCAPWDRLCQPRSACLILLPALRSIPLDRLIEAPSQLRGNCEREQEWCMRMRPRDHLQDSRRRNMTFPYALQGSCTKASLAFSLQD